MRGSSATGVVDRGEQPPGLGVLARARRRRRGGQTDAVKHDHSHVFAGARRAAHWGALCGSRAEATTHPLDEKPFTDGASARSRAVRAGVRDSAAHIDKHGVVRK